MLTKSLAMAELAQRGLVALGASTNSLTHPFSLIDLFESDASGWQQAAGTLWSNTFVAEDAQLATLTHAEMATDRFCQQLRTYMGAVQGDSDPQWTAITGYYLSFYAAQTLLLQAGGGAVRISGSGSLPFRGVLRVERQTLAGGRVEITLSRVGKGSHRATWDQTSELIDDLVANESDARTIVILKTLRSEIKLPQILSDLRNEINYDLTSSPFMAASWSSLFMKVASTDELEDELSRASQLRAERFEIVTMGLAALSSNLRNEFHGRGGRLDKRQKAARQATRVGAEWLVRY